MHAPLVQPARTAVKGVAVDAEGTLVREDAVWVDAVTGGGWRVHVSVPDVASEVPREAETMLATRAGSGRRRELSLTLERPMPTLTLELVVSGDGHRLDFRVYRSSLQLAATTTFPKASEIAQPCVPGLEHAAEAALALRCWQLSTHRPGHDPPSKPRPHRAVTGLLVAANLAATRLVHTQGRGLVFSCPSASLIHGGRKRWSARPERMEALLAQEYATFTTALNRHTDLVNLRCLLAAADGAPEPYSPAELGEAAARQTSLDAEPLRLRRLSQGLPERDLPPLSGMTPSTFASHVLGTCRREQPSDGFDDEVAARLLEGGMFASTLPMVLLHPDSPASAATRALAVEVLRGAAGGAWLVSFWAQVCDLQAAPTVVLSLPEGDEEHGYTVWARHMDMTQPGQGATPEQARRDALGRLAAVAAGTDPDAPPRADARLMWPAHERFARALRAHGLRDGGTRYGKSGHRHVAHVDVTAADGTITSFAAHGATKSRALEEAYEAGLSVLGQIEPQQQQAETESARSAQLLEDILAAHPGRPSRALAYFCKLSGLPALETDTLRGDDIRARCRVAAAGMVVISTAANGQEAREQGASQILDAIALRATVQTQIQTRLPGH